METPAKRLEELYNYYQTNASDIELRYKEIKPNSKFSKQNLYNIEKEKTKNISVNNANVIKEVFPNINREWLLTGNGTMLEVNKERPSISKSKGVPYFDVDFMGGFDIVANSQVVQPSFYINFAPFNDADFWVNITGKSMSPFISHGDIVALKEINDWRTFIPLGEIYAVVTSNDFRTIKIVSEGKDENHYKLVPYSKDPVFSEQSIPKSIITHLFKVKGSIKKFF